MLPQAATRIEEPAWYSPTQDLLHRALIEIDWNGGSYPSIFLAWRDSFLQIVRRVLGRGSSSLGFFRYRRSLRGHDSFEAPNRNHTRYQGVFLGVFLGLFVRGVLMNILVSLEDSAFGKVLADFVCQHEWPPHSNLKLVHVIPPIPMAALGGIPMALPASTFQQDEDASMTILEEVADCLAGKFEPGHVSNCILEGNVAWEILNLAKEWPADIIVMGSHARTGLDRLLLGSVSSEVMAKAACPVYVLRIPQTRLSARDAA